MVPPVTLENRRKTISVIITAHTREDYLDDAVKSVLSQKGNYSLSEIIVVKNFNHEKLDKWLTDSKIKTVFSNGSIGEDLVAGIQQANGEIICFLDDDDLFEPLKLAHVSDVFENVPELGFYHNAFNLFNEQNYFIRNALMKQPINPKIIKSATTKDLHYIFSHGGHVNMSSICIPKKMISGRLEILVKITGVPDDFCLFSALDSGYYVFLDTLRLTKYRVHLSASHQSGSLGQFAEDATFRLTTWMESYNVILSSIKVQMLRELCRCRISRENLVITILKQDFVRKDVTTLLIQNIKCTTKFHIRTTIFIMISTVISFMSKRIGRFMMYIVRTKILNV